MACIGCKQCVWVAPATFRMEDTHGRSRVFGQVGQAGVRVLDGQGSAASSFRMVNAHGRSRGFGQASGECWCCACRPWSEGAAGGGGCLPSAL